MPEELKRTSPDSSPTTSTSSDSPPTKSSKMELENKDTGPGSLELEKRLESADAAPSTPSAPPMAPDIQVEELVQAELGKHHQLDDQSRLIISLTVSITAKFLNQHSIQNHINTTNSISKLEATIARVDTQQKTFEDKLSAMSTKFENRFTEYDKTIAKLNNHISDLQQTVSVLTKTNDTLQYHIDEVEQYERRDSLVFSGKALPKETDNENTTDIIIQVLRQTLFMDDLRRSDINVCHRLGGKRKDRRGNLVDRPIICKFMSRSVKRDIKQACLDLKPDLFANESLTNIRREIFTKLRFVRKNHKTETNSELFPQLYTNDGKIMIKLQNKQKYMVTNPLNLEVFLNEYPDIKNRYQKIKLHNH